MSAEYDPAWREQQALASEDADRDRLQARRDRAYDHQPAVVRASLLLADRRSDRQFEASHHKPASRSALPDDTQRPSPAGRQANTRSQTSSAAAPPLASPRGARGPTAPTLTSDNSGPGAGNAGSA